MIDLYYAPTPNGWKISIMLEECGLAYAVKPVNIGAGEQFAPEFQRVSPNGRIPAIVDHAPAGGGDPVSVFETGAILLYLAEKTGQFMPLDLRGRYQVLQWLMWQMGGLGPMLGQNGHFKLYAPEKLPYAIDRYARETHRLYAVLDRRLAEADYVAGAHYTIADMAIFPWIMTHKRQEITLADYPHIARWYALCRARPALQAGLALMKEALNRNPQQDAQARETLFGITT